MENQDYKKKILERQLIDVQSQAEKILMGQNSFEAIESFSKYSEELKKYIITNFTENQIIESAEKIRLVDYKRNKIKFWHFLTFSFWLVYLQQYFATQKSIEEVGIVKNEWSSFYMLYKSII